MFGWLKERGEGILSACVRGFLSLALKPARERCAVTVDTGATQKTRTSDYSVWGFHPQTGPYWYCLSVSIVTLYFLFFAQVMGSKTKIFIVLEFVTGGELFDKIVSIKISIIHSLFSLCQMK